METKARQQGVPDHEGGCNKNPPSSPKTMCIPQCTDTLHKRSSIPLTFNRAILFEKLKGWSNFPNSKDDCHKSNKYCKYHKDYAHLTKHCRELTVYINYLVLQGELDEYVKNPRDHQQDRCKPTNKVGHNSHSNNPGRSDNSENRTQKTINVIYNGLLWDKIEDTLEMWCCPH